MTSRFYLATFIITLLLPLSACERAKEQMGLTRHSPDEFTVMQRAPLALPSDFSQLPPPNPGAPRPQDVPATDLAKTAILGEGPTAPVSSATAPSKAEALILSKANAGHAQAGIRSKVNREAAENTTDKRAVVKKILGMGSDEKAATVVDAPKEAERILKQKAAGQKVTGDQTPTIEQ